MNKNYKDDFPVFQKYPDLIYFDSAATSLKTSSVIDQEINYYKNNSTSVHRGVYNLSYQATKLFEDTRKNVAKFLNCNEESVIFTSGTTSSINMLALMFEDYIKEGDVILTSEIEHHSNYLPWYNLAKRKKALLTHIPLDEKFNITLNNVQKVFSNNVKIIAITHMSNTIGQLINVEPIFEFCRNNNCISILDCAQSVIYSRLDVQKLKCDFLAFSAHKIFGPTGIGILYGKKNILDNLKPVIFGGEMVEKIKTNDVIYKDIPMRFEAGTPNIAGVIGFSAALNYLTEINQDTIYDHSNSLKQYFLEKVKDVKEIIIYNKWSNSGIILFNILNIHPHDVSTYLDQYKIAIRAGHHCAQLVSRLISVDASLRISFSIYNDKNEIDIFINIIKDAINFFK